MKEKHKELEKLVKAGYVKMDIKYKDYYIYKSGNLRVIYDFKNDNIIHKYKRWRR